MHSFVKHPSGIPKRALRDRPLILLATVRRNLLERYAFLSHRVNPKNPQRSIIEKDRTQKRKEIRRELKEVEHSIMRFLGEHTHHPEIYTPSPKERPLVNLTPVIRDSPHDTPQERRQKERARKNIKIIIEEIPSVLSTYDSLKRRWRVARQQSGSQINAYYRRQGTASRKQTRHRMAQEIQDLEWKWMSRLHERLFPNTPLPPRHFIHPRHFKL